MSCVLFNPLIRNPLTKNGFINGVFLIVVFFLISGYIQLVQFIYFRSAIYSDSVSMYVTMKKYRCSTYANNSSGWVFLDAAEQVFKITKERVYNDKEGKVISFVSRN